MPSMDSMAGPSKRSERSTIPGRVEWSPRIRGGWGGVLGRGGPESGLYNADEWAVLELCVEAGT